MVPLSAHPPAIAHDDQSLYYGAPCVNFDSVHPEGNYRRSARSSVCRVGDLGSQPKWYGDASHSFVPVCATSIASPRATMGTTSRKAWPTPVIIDPPDPDNGDRLIHNHRGPLARIRIRIKVSQFAEGRPGSSVSRRSCISQFRFSPESANIPI